jgi:ferredoxin
MGPDKAEVKVEDVLPAEYEDAVQQAADECPVEAIVVE